MKVEIGSFKITKFKTTIELTGDEAKDLYYQLQEHFGLKLGSSSVLGGFNNTELEGPAPAFDSVDEIPF